MGGGAHVAGFGVGVRVRGVAGDFPEQTVQLDLAEGGEEGTYDDEEEADDLDKGLDGRDPIKAPGGSSLAGERVLTMPRRSGGASRFGLWWTMLLAIFVATVTMLTYFYRHRAARLFRMPMSLNVV